MKWPELVPDSMCNTPITILFEDGINEDGSPKKTVILMANATIPKRPSRL